jgi:hypothetical protein
LNPWAPWADGVFQDGGDFLWIQAMTEAAGQTGPAGSTLHLGWPVGYSQWSHPQLGLAYLTLAAILVAWVGLSSAGAVWFLLAVSAGLSSVCVVFLFRSLVGNRVWGLSLVLAWVLCTSPYVWMKATHTNVALFFLIPLMFAVILRLDFTKRRTYWALLFCLLLASTASPLWWVIVGLLVAILLLLVQLVRRSWSSAICLVAVTSSIVVGAFGQFLLVRHFAIPGAAESRGPWDSNVVGGFLADLILASPFVNAHVPWGANLRIGGSVELGFVGIVGGTAAILAVIVAISGVFVSRSNEKQLLLSQMTLIVLLFFITGGLGNLQAALAVVLGSASPARAWSRLIIVLAILGCTWAVVIIDAWREKRKAQGVDRPRWMLVWLTGFATFCACAGLLDTAWSTRVIPTPNNELPEYGAVSYLAETRAPCPVAQLPQDGFTRYRLESDVGTPVDVNKYPWRGFIPYLLEPEFSWSFTSWIPNAKIAMNRVGSTLDDQSLKLLKDEGFCAVLYDKALADAARKQGVFMEGRRLGNGIEPDFDSERYSVYNLGAS